MDIQTPKQFKSCMLLESIAISPDGNLQFYYNDGDLFWGHCIAVTMDSSDRFIDADL
ncbi:MAG: DUF2262 domain-containing protein [Oscillatoriaceae cyanobacterium Prado104]|jgi:hypothetical protein|nr:DUF2262 domain-containing protein [Oscillatoriaceae cyanobacterium Prado104]